ncbi:MAG TPA: glycosyltransferase family 4 protein [Gemmatimonadales bacterium]|jgi:glycosyltransferase involved in cell wall biosynthesis|nr:glycosyltransferase family 4 protein [Gemmatimonadales bacterium]
MFSSGRAVTLRGSLEGIPVTELPVGRTSLRAVRRLRRALIEHRIDVLIVDKRRDVVHGAAAVFGLRIALVARYLFPEWTAPGDPLFRLAYPRVDLTNFLTVGAVDHVAAAAPFILRRPHNVINEGVDTGRFRPDPAAAAALHRRFDLPDGPVVAGVGALEPEKRYETLLAAVATLPDPRPAVLLVGAGSQHEPLRARAAAWGVELRLPGTVAAAELPAVYAGATVFVHPSSMEAFGLAVAEAMASECPVVVARAGSLPEVVGDAGVIVPPDDRSALSAALGRLLADGGERAARGRQGRARVVERFTLERMQRGHVEALTRLAEARQ